MPDFLEIKDAWIAADALITAGLLTRLRDNPEALYENTQTFARKASNQAEDSLDTLQDDDDLVFAVGANEVWHVQGAFSYTSHVTPLIQWALVGPTGSTGHVYELHEHSGAASLHGENAALGATQQADAGATAGEVFWQAYVVTGSTAGNIALQWSQITASGNTTTVLAGGYIRGHRMDEISTDGAITPIADGDLDAKSPIKTTTVMAALRNSGIGIYECQRKNVLKSADESVSSASTGTTLQDDDELTFDVGTEEDWYVIYCLGVASGTVPDFKFDLNVPAGATGTLLGVHSNEAGTTAQDFVHTVGTPEAIPTFANHTLIFEGIVTTVGTGGNVVLEWAQNTADAGNTTVQKDSFLIAHRMDKIAPTDAVFGAITDADIDPESEILETTAATLEGLRDNIAAVYNTTRVFVVKPGDETVTSASTGSTLQDDDDLTFAVDANSQWEVLIAIDLATTQVADWKFLLSTPDAADVGAVFLYHEHVSATSMEGHQFAINTSTPLTVGGNITEGLVVMRCYILMDVVAGNVTLQWAQNTSNANPTTVGQNSFLYARRMDALT